MRIYADTSTRRLEELARGMGVDCEIRKIEAQEEGRYFVITLDQVPLKWPVPLGFTEAQAGYAIKRRTWERYAVRGGTHQLKRTGTSRSARHSKRRRYPW